MSTSPISELIIPYDPEPLAEKVGRRRRLVRSRVISLVITIALLLLIYLWRREDMQGAVFVVIYVLVLGTSLAWLAASIVLYVLAKREARTLGSGIAIRIGPPGIQVAELAVHRGRTSRPSTRSRAGSDAAREFALSSPMGGRRPCLLIKSMCFPRPWTALSVPSQQAVTASTCRRWKVETTTRSYHCPCLFDRLCICEPTSAYATKISRSERSSPSMPIATPEVYTAMLDAAKKGSFAYPAINVSSSQTLNAALQGFTEAGSDGIIQVSTGGAEYAVRPDDQEHGCRRCWRWRRTRTRWQRTIRSTSRCTLITVRKTSWTASCGRCSRCRLNGSRPAACRSSSHTCGTVRPYLWRRTCRSPRSCWS